jgi:hypothetical protein
MLLPRTDTNRPPLTETVSPVAVGDTEMLGLPLAFALPPEAAADAVLTFPAALPTVDAAALPAFAFVLVPVGPAVALAVA